MRPIKLKIKGLNSFIDNQEVDFERLTSKGLFGIFGPTGSGKSTILDGITLALYGEVARKSSNFINTNCDSLNVSFEFQISGNEIKKYRVERGFKRESKTGNIRSKSAKIIDITEACEKVLEDQAKLVTGKCEEIIGLELDDFTRTVVLPQGKFSEFLKLEGKERRNMLERLFNLQKYGDELSFKLVNKIKKEREKSNILDGELKGYEKISETIFDEKTKQVEEIIKQRDKCQIEFKVAEDKFNKGKELWELQGELKEQVHKEKELKEKEEEINDSKRKVALGESALKVKPYVDGYENTLEQISTATKKVLCLRAEIEIIKENKQKLEDKLNLSKNRKDKELPELKMQEQKVKEAMEEKVILNALIKERASLENIITNIEENLKGSMEQTKNNEISINEINNNINKKEEKVETLKISEEYKKKINDGIVILNSYENLLTQKNNLSKIIIATCDTIKNATKESEKLSGFFKEKESLLVKNSYLLKNLIEICPGDQDILLTFQEKLSSIKDKWGKYKEYSEATHKSNDIIEILRKELKDKENEKETLEKEINEINEKIKKSETENLAHTLRESLLEGKPCPVCGSSDHHKDNVVIIDTSNLHQLKLNLTKKEQENKNLTEEIIKAQTNIGREEINKKEKQEKISALGETFKLTSIETYQTEFDKLKVDINNFNVEKANLEKNIKVLREDKNSIENKYTKQNTIFLQNNSQLERLQDEFNCVEQKSKILFKELTKLRVELALEDFKSKSDEIIKKEKEKSTLENLIKLLRNSLKEEVKQKENLYKQVGEYREKLSDKKRTLIEKNKNIEEKVSGIKNKVGDIEDLEKFKGEICSSIKKIEADYMQAEEQKKQIEEIYNECNNNKIAAESNAQNLNERIENDKENLDKALIEEAFKDINEAKNSFIIKSEIEKLKVRVEWYRDSLAKVANTIENLNSKIGNKSLTEEEWIKIQNIKTEKTEILKELEKTKIKLEEDIKATSQKLVELKELLKRKEKLDYKLSILDDLEKLFKGKKFVEFVAINQLKYVSIEACKRLKEITGGNYGLEVDENGKFLIRDYKNGGAQRDASTLSGGETFLVSLALALALSAQIQLKGTAPLELFFLDEGFGTLDDNMLEVVMDSLEKIHNEKLSIGIISHIESIKNRVQIKLMVTAAESGMGGSKVKIEIS